MNEFERFNPVVDKHERHWPDQPPVWNPNRETPITPDIDTDIPLREGEDESIPSLPNWPDDDDQEDEKTRDM